MLGGIGSVLSGVGAVAGLFGGKKEGTGTQKTFFESLPPEVQKALLKTYLPDVMDYYSRDFVPRPAKRATKPTDAFGSQALYELQQYADINGLLRGGTKKTTPKADTSGLEDVIGQLALGNDNLLSGALFDPKFGGMSGLDPKSRNLYSGIIGSNPDLIRQLGAAVLGKDNSFADTLNSVRRGYA